MWDLISNNSNKQQRSFLSFELISCHARDEKTPFSVRVSKVEASAKSLKISPPKFLYLNLLINWKLKGRVGKGSVVGVVMEKSSMEASEILVIFSF